MVIAVTLHTAMTIETTDSPIPMTSRLTDSTIAGGRENKKRQTSLVSYNIENQCTCPYKSII